jgi:hypothetical protein
MQSMNPAGRPKKQLDWDVVDNLLKLGMPGTKIASYFALHHDTLYDRCLTEKGVSFTEYSAHKYAEGETPLLQKQYEKAVAGDNQMLIHLGKCRLKQYAYEPESAQQDKALIKALLEHIQNQTRNPLADSDNADAKPV